MPWSTEYNEVESATDLRKRTNKYIASEPRTDVLRADIAFALEQACSAIDQISSRKPDPSAKTLDDHARRNITASDARHRFYVKLTGHACEGGGAGDSISIQVVRTV